MKAKGINRRARLVTACVLLTFVFPVLLSGQKVKVDYDKSVEFTKFKTFTWGKLAPARMPLLRLNIVGAINEQLAAKGLVEVEKNADVVVTYAGDTAGEMNQGVSAPTYPGYAGPPPAIDATMWTGSSGSGGTGMTVSYPKGTLIVELMDPHADKIAWRAVGSLNVDMEKKSESVKRINEMIAKMFVLYPPQKK